MHVQHSMQYLSGVFYFNDYGVFWLSLIFLSINVYTCIMCSQILNVDTQYVGHFLRIPYRDYPTIFEEVLREKGDCVIEVDEMR